MPDHTSPPDAAPSSNATPPARLTDYILLPLMYFVSARLGVVLSVMPEGMAILWPPNGVLLAYCLRFGPRSYPAFGALAIVVELIVDVPKYRVSDALLFGVINVTEVTIASLLLRRAQFNPRFTHISDLTKFVVAVPVTAAFIGAVFGALVYDRMPGNETAYFQFLRIWWFGDALGMMIVTPLVLSAWTHTRSLTRHWPRLRASDIGVALAAAGVIGLLIASRDGTLMGTHVGPVLVLPFAIFAAIRFGSSAAAVVVSAVTVLILVLTTQGRNPFGADAPRDAVIHAQEFIFVLSVMTLGIAALVSHVRASQQDLTTLNEALEQRVQERTRDLQDALSHVKQLRGLLPICAWCKAVRDDHDYWHSVEEYISDRTDAQFSHGICPDCARDMYKSGKALEGIVGSAAKGRFRE